MSADVEPGTEFAGLRVDGVVGRGGMGVVLHATDAALGRSVAIKLVAPELAGDPRFRERFLREARLAASLDHPHVVPIYEAGEADGRLYLAMRFVDGTDLKRLLAAGPVAPERLVGILAQIAEALDAAHAHGLVHRDVKPANVLLDGDDHAYLTDFGVTKRLGSDSTDAGQIVGTLEYLAPEQIRGDAIDARTDVYGLACVSYEGLAGIPPFRRRTEAETLWAHMHDDPPRTGDAALDAALARGLAKDPARRHGTCAELIGAVADALAHEGSPPRRGRRRWWWAGLGAGALAVAAAAVAAFTAGGPAEERSTASGVAAISAGGGRLASLTPAASPPSNVAVGEGAVWALSTTDPTVSRIDPRTKRVMSRFQVGGVPSDIAAGAGAVWVGRGGGKEFNSTVAVAQVDPLTRRVTRTIRLPSRGDDAGWPSVGFPGMAIGAGALWAITPGSRVARIDPRDGRIVAQIGADAHTIAAGDAGVWFATDDGVSRIDPRTNRIAQRIRTGANVLGGIAVGAGAVWAAGVHEGLLWRIDPGSHPVTRTIDIGPGVSFLAFGDGAVWAANSVDAEVARIDPRTNAVTARVRIGAPQALAAGAGSAWVSVAGGARDGALPASSCADVVSGGRRPDVLIASDLPLQGPISAGPQQLAQAIRIVLERAGFRAGRHTVGYASCDASTTQSGVFEFRRCAANANGYASAERLVAIIGPYNSDCAAVQLPILNRAPGGPPAVISPSNTYPGLTRAVSVAARGGGYRGEPGVFYPSGVRNYARLGSDDDLAGTADAMLARQLGVRNAYLLDDGGGSLDVFVTHSFRYAADRLGVGIAGASTYRPGAHGYADVAERVARAGADAVVIGGDIYEGAGRLMKDLRARLGRDVVLMGGSYGFVPLSEVIARAGSAARGLYVSTIDEPAPLRGATPAARDIARALGTNHPLPYALHAAQATEMVLDAIARSDGSRASVVRELRRARVRDGILGTFRLDANGDITPAPVTILRITGATPSGSGLSEDYAGAVVDRIVRVPPDLVQR